MQTANSQSRARSSQLGTQQGLFASTNYRLSDSARRLSRGPYKLGRTPSPYEGRNRVRAQAMLP